MGAPDMPPRKGTRKTPEHRAKIAAAHLARGIRLKPKRCPACGVTKDQSDFYQHERRTHPYCKPCTQVKRKQQREADPSRTRENDKRQRLRRDYGISLADWDGMFYRQGLACAICREEPPTSGARPGFFVDHDHASGYVRGLLCNTCNRAIGMLRDSPDLLEAAAAYLRASRRRESAGVPAWDLCRR